MIRYYVDKLPPGQSHACSVRKIKEVIKSLPPEDLKGIRSVRLCVHHSREDGVYLSDGRIELRWAVDAERRRRIGRRPPSPAMRAELARYGGACLVDGGIYYASWADRDQLERYVLFVLLHEIGHHVCARRHLARQRRLTAAQEEQFADAYARRYLPANLGHDGDGVKVTPAATAPT